MLITTIVTDDYFQLYLPLFVYVLRKNYPEYEVKTFIRGKVSSLCEEAFKVSGGAKPISIFKDIPLKQSTINCLRFLVPQEHFKDHEYVFFMDVDLLIFHTDPDLLKWHLGRMKETGSCYAGYHGPRWKPYRPEVSVDGWKGDFERVAGGCFMATQEWFKKTKKARKHYLNKAEKGELGGYREIDEVMLCDILKKSKLPIVTGKVDKGLRGIHLGDFKKGMEHRYNSRKKMRKKLTKENCRKFFELEKDKTWIKLCKIVKQEEHIHNVMSIARKVLRERLG